MKKNNGTVFIIIAGLFILVVFGSVLSINLKPNYESNSYLASGNDDINVVVDELAIEGEKLVIRTSGEGSEFCVKSTKSTPNLNNMCWKKLEDGIGEVSIYKYKKYYVWIKDKSDNISKMISINE